MLRFKRDMERKSKWMRTLNEWADLWFPEIAEQKLSYQISLDEFPIEWNSNDWPGTVVEWWEAGRSMLQCMV